MFSKLATFPSTHWVAEKQKNKIYHYAIKYCNPDANGGLLIAMWWEFAAPVNKSCSENDNKLTIATQFVKTPLGKDLSSWEVGEGVSNTPLSIWLGRRGPFMLDFPLSHHIVTKRSQKITCHFPNMTFYHCGKMTTAIPTSTGSGIGSSQCWSMVMFGNGIGTNFQASPLTSIGHRWRSVWALDQFSWKKYKEMSENALPKSDKWSRPI